MSEIDTLRASGHASSASLARDGGCLCGDMRYGTISEPVRVTICPLHILPATNWIGFFSRTDLSERRCAPVFAEVTIGKLPCPHI